MESRAEYLTQQRGRPGKQYIGGYIDSNAAQRLRMAAEAEGITVVELLERMSQRVVVDFKVQGCGCCHE